MLLACLGSFVGLLIGITGVGGGILAVPLLVLATGRPMLDCVGTALFFSAIVKSYATLQYYFYKSIDGPVLGRLVLGGLPGAVGGSILAQYFSATHTYKVLPKIVGGIVAVTAGITLLRRPHARPPSSHRSGLVTFFAYFIGVEIGFSAAGSGALGSMLLFNMTTLAPAKVVGTDLAFGLALSLAGAFVHVSMGHWRPELVAPFGLGGLCGAFWGTSLARILPATLMRRIVLIAAIILGFGLVAQGI